MNTLDIKDQEDSDDSTDNTSSECFLYDTNTKPKLIEKIFGEPYHVNNKYPAHQITISCILQLAAVYIVEGCIDWMLIAARYYGIYVLSIIICI